MFTILQRVFDNWFFVKTMSDDSSDDEQQWTLDDSMQKLALCFEESGLSVEELFAQIDSDDDGSINGPELYNGLKSVSDQTLSPGQISVIIKAFDSDGDNRIDLAELSSALEGGEQDSSQEE